MIATCCTTKWPGQEDAAHGVEGYGVQGMLEEGLMRHIESLPVLAPRSSRTIGVLPEEDLHDTIHREIEEVQLQVHRSSLPAGLAQHCAKLLGLFLKDFLHQSVEVVPGEDLGRNLALEGPALPLIWRVRAMESRENAIAQKCNHVVSKEIVLGLSLGVFWEAVLQKMADDEWVSNNQHMVLSHEWVAMQLAERKAHRHLCPPVVYTMEVPQDIRDEAISTFFVPRLRHIFQHPPHPPCSSPR
mmetsp:Transcript_74783/g.134757  ORF Transcript_74783/g.134757 Transcript_74783/m.134757 type:complete len:243 (+) Transcript_74783:941-1669(+)